MTRTSNSTDRAGTRRPRGRWVRTALAAAAWLACAAQVHALGLGRLNVQSALGEPLVAEIDVTSLTQEQAASLRVGVASAEVYRAAGMEFTEVLRGVQVTLARRPDGRAVLRITSDRAARDPFVDLILQATWASGRLVREYTVLLDPPRSGASQTEIAATPPVPGDPPAAAAAAWGTRLAGSAASPAPSAAATQAAGIAGAGRPAERPSSPRPAEGGAAPPNAAATPAAARAATSGAPPAGPAPVVRSLPAPGAAPAATASTGAAPAANAVTTAPSAAPPGAVSTAGAALSGPITSTATPSAGPALSTAGSGAAAAEGPAVSTRADAPSSPAAREVKTATPAVGTPARAGGTAGAGTQGPREVRPGETLYGIARSVRPESVSLDQMLVALYRDNPQAFVGNNMNRLLAGATLQVPTAEVAGAIPVAEARQLIVAQSADLAAYRQRLAARPAATPGEEPQRAASGTVQARVQDRAQAKATDSDQLKLSRGNVKAGASPEAALSAKAEAKDLAQRESELARDVEALRRLEAGSAPGGAGASKAGAADPAAVPAGARAATASAAAASAAPLAVTAALTQPGEAAAPAASSVAPAASTPAPAASAADPAGSAAAPAAPASQPALATRLQEAVTSSPYILPAAGGLVLLLAALGSYSLLRRRRKHAASVATAGEGPLDPALDSQTPAAAAGRPPRPEFATAMAAAATTLAESAPVLDDAVAESPSPAPRATDHLADAEVYLAYGRHDEAVAVLRAGLQAEPRRSDIAFKLLELHAARQEFDDFEAVADVMYERTSGQGPEWARVVALQRTLAPREDSLPPQAAPLPSVEKPAPAPAPLRAAAQAMPAAVGGRREPTLGPEPVEVPASDFALDTDVSAIGAQARARESGAVDLGLGESPPLPATAPGASGEALDRKLALAEEFIQIGDVEGARDLVIEVASQADGPLKERAQRLLDALG